MAVPPKNHRRQFQNKEIIKYLVIRTIGNFLVLFTIFGIVATFGPALFFESQYQLSKILNIQYKVAQKLPSGPSELTKILQGGQMRKTQPNLFDEILKGKRDEILYPVDPSFSVMIPKIGANSRITPNVNPDNEEEYLRVLSQTIAHAKGTSFPGLNGTTYLFAHSVDNFWSVGRYNAVFYLLNKMEKGDEVVLFFNGKRYNYLVNETKIVNANETQYIDSLLGQGERVILQTCWPPGTTWKRLLVFATPKAN